MNKIEVIAWMVEGLKEVTMYEVVVMDWDDEGEDVESLIRLTDHEAVVEKKQETINDLAQVVVEQNEHTQLMVAVLYEIYDSLPLRRDWLDPVLEERMKDLLVKYK